ncbi:MAG: hypothetical protein QNI99_05870 [Woeseiaceae bacterium]|nr:hypothetical protein [Woeseiaceae bacterium]
MLRFVIVTILLLILVVFYATRLGEGDESAPEAEQSGVSSAEPSVALLDTSLVSTDVAHEDRRAADGVPYYADPRLNYVPNSFGCDMEALSANLHPTSHLRGQRDDDQVERLLETLAASGDAELQLATGQLTLQADWVTDDMLSQYGTMASIERAYATDPTNPLVLWNAIIECSTAGPSSFCSGRQLQANAWSVLGVDGQFWVRIATLHYKRDDKESALDALQQAAAAPMFDRYFIEHVRMMQRALSIVSEAGYGSQAFAAYSGAPMRYLFRVREACVAEAPVQSEWLDACLAVAERYASDAITIQERKYGSLLQADILAITGQEEASEAARARYRELDDSGWGRDEDVLAVLLADEQVMSLFLDELAVGGEVSARLFLSDEVDRLKEDPEYDPCPMKKRGVTQ